MVQGFTFGNQLIRLDEVESTNTFLQELIVEKIAMEGLVVVANHQTKGRGQRGNDWKTEPEKNLTFSLLLKPNLVVSEQFMISKTMALGIHDFLKALKVKNVKVKWPNDVMVNGKKIAGVLIENTLKQNKVANVIVGIGLNVNQDHFPEGIEATSIFRELGAEPDLKEMLDHLLIYLEKRYRQLRALNYHQLNKDYLEHLLGYQCFLNYQIDNEVKKAIIKGVSPEGKLQLQINGEVKEFGMKEVSLVI